ncbi:MAG: 4-(cytidine 5'-diphospho)-2-C-methyl-D-erythritol kinase, partial [Methylophilaceae bacterium]
MHDFQTFPAPAKVNLFLHITGRRADGYHLLQSVFRLLDFHDLVHLRPRKDGVIARSSEMAGVSESQDLTMRAASLLQQHTGSRLGVDISVEKRIPLGGGL